MMKVYNRGGSNPTIDFLSCFFILQVTVLGESYSFFDNSGPTVGNIIEPRLTSRSDANYRTSDPNADSVRRRPRLQTRDVKTESSRPVQLQFETADRHFDFRLEPAPAPVSSQAVFLIRRENRTDILDASKFLSPESEEETSGGCFFTGKSSVNNDEKIALDICNGLHGVVTTSHDYYVIKPLGDSPKETTEAEAKRPPSERTKRSSDWSQPHILIRQSKGEKPNVNNPKDFREKEPHIRRGREADLRARPVSHEPVERSLRDEAPQRSAAHLSQAQYFPLVEQVPDRGYFPSFISRDEELNTSDSNHLENFFDSQNSIEEEITEYETKDRLIRPDRERFFVELAVFVDKDLHRHMAGNFPVNTDEKIIQIVLAMINGVQLLYSDESLGVDIKFLIKRLEILQVDPPTLVRSYDIDRYLTNFCQWQQAENSESDADPLHWDHAVILTGLDVHVVDKTGKIASQVVGLAPVSGMCRPQASCTVNEGRHFESVYVMAHEIGHNLGMKHDGTNKRPACSPGRFIMSPTLGRGKVTWSPCSRNYLNQFLRSSQAACLTDNSEAEAQHAFEPNELPGERFPADVQCKLRYGKTSHHAVQQSGAELCTDLHCRRDHFTWTSHPALEGTACSEGHWCRKGKCVLRNDQSYRHHLKRQTPQPQVEDGHQDRELALGLHGDVVQVTDLVGDNVIEDDLNHWDRSSCRSSCLYSDKSGSLSSGSTGIITFTSNCKRYKESCDDHEGTRYLTCNNVKMCMSAEKRISVDDFAKNVCLKAGYTHNSDSWEAKSASGKIWQQRQASRPDSWENVMPSYDSWESLSDASLPSSNSWAGQLENLLNSNNPKTACTVHCPNSAGTLVGTREWYPDGTVCQRNSSITSFCIQGECRIFLCSQSQLQPDLSGQLMEMKNKDSYSYNLDSSHCQMHSSRDFDFNNRLETKTHIWTKWRPESKCIFPCLVPARGLQLVSRVCTSLPCEGIQTSLSLCEDRGASSRCQQLLTPFQFASQLCTDLQVESLSGIGMQLKSTSSDPDRACRVACQDKRLSYRFYIVAGEKGWFPYGTDCGGGDDSKNFCVKGKCLEFGSDNTPLYTSTDTHQYFSDQGFDHRHLVRRSLIVNGSGRRVAGSIDQSFLEQIVTEFNQTLMRVDHQSTNGNSPEIDLMDPIDVTEPPPQMPRYLPPKGVSDPRTGRDKRLDNNPVDHQVVRYQDDLYVQPGGDGAVGGGRATRVKLIYDANSGANPQKSSSIVLIGTNIAFMILSCLINSMML